MKNVKVVIEVRGGCIQSILSDAKLEVIVVDHDCQETSDATALSFKDGETAQQFISTAAPRWLL